MGTSAIPTAIYGVLSLVVVYGRSKIGKTSEEIYSFPDALFLAGKGCLKPAISVVGYEPPGARDDCDELPMILKAVREEAKKPKDKRRKSVVIDDFSLAVQNTLATLEKDGVKGWEKWNRIRRWILSPTDGLLTVLRDGEMHGVLNCHDKQPDGDDCGGPNLPGQLMEELPRNTDMVLWMAPDPGRQPHPACYRASLGSFPQWATGDRHNVCWDRTPPNLGEILRAAKFRIDRPAKFSWMEAWVNQIATAIIQQGPGSESMITPQAWSAMLAQGIPPQYAAWIMRDGRDRAEIARHEQQKWGLAFGIMG